MHHVGLQASESLQSRTAKSTQQIYSEVQDMTSKACRMIKIVLELFVMLATPPCLIYFDIILYSTLDYFSQDAGVG